MTWVPGRLWAAAAAVLAAALGAAVLSRRSRAGSSFASELVRAASRDLRAGVREDLGTNDGRRIREYFAGSGVTPPANWCAAAVTTWIREAARETGEAPPIPGSNTAKALRDQILAAGGEWYGPDDLRRDPSLVRPGQIAVWDRSRPGEPDTAWWGHVGVVVRGVRDGTFETVEGNSGDGTRVAQVSRRLDDPRLLGVGSAWPVTGSGVPEPLPMSIVRQRRQQLPPEEGGA